MYVYISISPTPLSLSLSLSFCRCLLSDTGVGVMAFHLFLSFTTLYSLFALFLLLHHLAFSMKLFHSLPLDFLPLILLNGSDKLLILSTLMIWPISFYCLDCDSSHQMLFNSLFCNSSYVNLFFYFILSISVTNNMSYFSSLFNC